MILLSRFSTFFKLVASDFFNEIAAWLVSLHVPDTKKLEDAMDRVSKAGIKYLGVLGFLYVVGHLVIWGSK